MYGWVSQVVIRRLLTATQLWLICNALWAHVTYSRADSRFAPSQRETALLCNDISHWLGASLESTLRRNSHRFQRSHTVSWDSPTQQANACRWDSLKRLRKSLNVYLSDNGECVTRGNYPTMITFRASFCNYDLHRTRFPNHPHNCWTFI